MKWPLRFPVVDRVFKWIQFGVWPRLDSGANHVAVLVKDAPTTSTIVKRINCYHCSRLKRIESLQRHLSRTCSFFLRERKSRIQFLIHIIKKKPHRQLNWKFFPFPGNYIIQIYNFLKNHFCNMIHFKTIFIPLFLSLNLNFYLYIFIFYLSTFIFQTSFFSKLPLFSTFHFLI